MPRDICKLCGEALEPEQIAARLRYCCQTHRTVWTERHRRAMRRGEEPKLMVRDPDHYYSRLMMEPPLPPDPQPPLLARLRLAEKDRCEHYDVCLYEVAKARGRFVPCVGCKAYLHVPQPVSVLQSNWPDESCFLGLKEDAA